MPPCPTSAATNWAISFARAGNDSPRAAGLPLGRRRRTPGLRREEVAELAGIGVDWYIRLEQGRSVSPSVTTVDALARALKLSKVEHAHLRALTRNPDRRAFVRETVPEAIRRVVESLNQPAYVTGRRWDVLAWNKPAEEVFAFSRLPEEDRNILIMHPDQARDPARVRRELERAGKTRGRAVPRDPRSLGGRPGVRRRFWPVCVATAPNSRLVEGTRRPRRHLRPQTDEPSQEGPAALRTCGSRPSDDPALKLVIYTPV